MHLLGAQVLRNLAPILLLFLLARLTNQDTVGSYSLALAIATPFFVFAQLGLRTVSLTLNPDANFTIYMRVQGTAVLLAAIGAALAAAFTSLPLLGLVALVGLLKTADAFSDFLSGPLQRRGQTVTILVSSFVYAAASSAAAALTLTFTKNLELTILAIGVVALITTALVLYRPARRLAKVSETAASNKLQLKRVLAAGVPLGATSGILALTSTFPQYVITSSHGEALTARFAILLYVFALADIATGTIAQAWIPNAQHRLAHNKNLSTLALALRASLKWSAVYIPTVVLGLTATAALFPIIFGQEYTLSLTEAIWLGASILALPFAHFTAMSVAIENQYIHSVTLAVVSTTVAAAIGITCIPEFGISGAFAALFASIGSRGITATVILLWFKRKSRRALNRDQN